MSTGSRSSAPNAREWDEEEEGQGPRVFYSSERRWGATPEGEATWMGYTNNSCCGDKHDNGVLPVQASRWELKERR